MDPKDLLYTNTFSKTQSLSQKQLQENANNFLPYRTLKTNSVNNVRDDLERTVFNDNPILERQRKAYGWNKGGTSNQRPVLSDFARDIGESSYFRYRTSYLNIDSRMRDVSLFPTPNNYNIFLGRKFDNVESIKLIDYFFPNTEYPINTSNNVIMWFTCPFEMLQYKVFVETFNLPPFDPGQPNFNIVTWYADLNTLILINGNCEESVVTLRNNLLKSLFVIEIPPGNYTTEELADTITKLWRNQTFFDSVTFDKDNYIVNPCSPTAEFINRPQLVKVRIDPVTSAVDFMLRYEEIKVDLIRSYNGKNYVDIRLKAINPLVASEEYNRIANNEYYPLIATDLPSIGGIEEYNLNYVEFVTKIQYEQFALANIVKTYYDIVVDENTGNIIPNMIRLFLFNSNGRKIVCSYTDQYIVEEKCAQLCKSMIGREAPYFLIKGNTSPLFSFLSNASNNAAILNPYDCRGPAKDCTGSTDPSCLIIPADDIALMNKYICNLDGSIRLLTNLLGFLDTSNSLAQVGPGYYAFAITPNIIYKSNRYINTLQTSTIAFEESVEYLTCQNDQGNPKQAYLTYDYNDNVLNFKLPVCKNSDGTYSFYLNNYMFLKLLNPVLSNQLSSSQIIQVRSTPNFSNGSSALYYYDTDAVQGLTLNILPPPTEGSPCEVPGLYKSIAGVQQLTKDVDGLFAKIKFSSETGMCNVDNPFTNEVIYFEGNVTNLDYFVVQLVDFEGKILQNNKDHCFTLMLVEKIEVLKETNINSRTGYVNSSGSINVQRNNFSM